MTGILIAINFVISLLAIFFVIILYLKFSKVQQLEQDYHQLLKEAEDTISGYVFELKEENKEFLAKLSEQKSSLHHLEEEKPFVDEKEPELTQTDIQSLLGQVTPIAEDSFQSKQEDFAELSTSDQVAHLVEKGHSIEEIAKKLDKGKTEIELLWKFRQ